MNDDELVRKLQSVGKACFVKYYSLFSSDRVDRADIVETLKSENTYTENSCISRAGHARAIVLAGRSCDALNMVVASNSPRVSQETRDSAQLILNCQSGSA